MEKLHITLDTHAKMRIDTEKGIAWELRDHFAFFVPGYEWMPRYRAKAWDGKIKLFDFNYGTLPAGLFSKLQEFCKVRDYEIVLEKSPYGHAGAKGKVDPKEVWEFCKSLNLHSKGNKIEVRDYQFNAICKALEDKRLLLLSPTGSGKSLIIYVLLRWLAEKKDDKLLVIVPTTQLVDQMYTDFEDYSSHDDSFRVHDWCHRIYAGQAKTNVHERIFISTWQSIYKLPKTWFSQFGSIFGDEAHNFTSDSLTKSMDKAANAEYRVGTTGTLDGTKTHELVLEGVFGPIYKVTTTKKLQDEDTLAQLEIKMLELVYPEDTRALFAKVKYAHEIDWIVRNEQRNRFIKNLALDMKGNTLVMFQFVQKHGKVLYEIIRQAVGENRKVFFVAGEVDKADREAVRKIVETETDAIIIASLGVFSTGVNIRNLHNIIFASPSKSQIKILQSIGRGLRKSDNGWTTNLYDIIDNLVFGKRENYAFRHGRERKRIYAAQEFNVKHFRVQFK